MTKDENGAFEVDWICWTGASIIAPKSLRSCRVARTGNWSDVSANHGNEMEMRWTRGTFGGWDFECQLLEGFADERSV